MPPRGPVAVLFDDEVHLVASVGVTRAIAGGEIVTTDDFDDLRNLIPASSSSEMPAGKL
jgi:hypothetical protein